MTKSGQIIAAVDEGTALFAPAALAANARPDVHSDVRAVPRVSARADVSSGVHVVPHVDVFVDVHSDVTHRSRVLDRGY